MQINEINVFLTAWNKKYSPKFINYLSNSLAMFSEKRSGVGHVYATPPIIRVLFNLSQLKIPVINIYLIQNECEVLTEEFYKMLGFVEKSQEKQINLIIIKSPQVKKINFMLTWQHKEILKKITIQNVGRKVLYLYLEHDINFTQANLEYYLDNLEIFQKHNLFPDFLRIEWARGSWFFTDLTEPLSKNKVNYLNGIPFIKFDKIYSGMYILNQAMAEKHLNSPFLNYDSCKSLGELGISELAALGARYDGSNPGEIDRATSLSDMTCNSVVPLNINLSNFHPGSLLWHLNNRYASNSLIKSYRKFGSIQTINPFI